MLSVWGCRPLSTIRICDRDGRTFAAGQCWLHAFVLVSFLAIIASQHKILTLSLSSVHCPRRFVDYGCQIRPCNRTACSKIANTLRRVVGTYTPNHLLFFHLFVVRTVSPTRHSFCDADSTACLLCTRVHEIFTCLSPRLAPGDGESGRIQSTHSENRLVAPFLPYGRCW